MKRKNKTKTRTKTELQAGPLQVEWHLRARVKLWFLFSPCFLSLSLSLSPLLPERSIDSIWMHQRNIDRLDTLAESREHSNVIVLITKHRKPGKWKQKQRLWGKLCGTRTKIKKKRKDFIRTLQRCHVRTFYRGNIIQPCFITASILIIQKCFYLFWRIVSAHLLWN